MKNFCFAECSRVVDSKRETNEVVIQLIQINIYVLIQGEINFLIQILFI